MKICLFADAGSVHIQQLAPGLAARGHDVHVVTHKPTSVPGATVERFRIPGPGLINPRRWEGRRMSYLRGFMRRFDVVNVHFLLDWGFRFGLPKVENACLIASPWGSDIVHPPGESPPTPELTQSRIILLRNAHAVTACGPAFARMVAHYAGVDRSHIDILPFGVDVEAFRRSETIAAATLGERAGPYRVGFFKGFREVYGPTYLIQAVPSVLARIPGVRFELVGDGAQLSRCRNLASDLGVNSSIEWIPRQPHRDLPRRIARWDVSVIPSVQEAFGVAALESSAMEVPVVASNVGGLKDTVRHGETGLLVPPRSPQALADAVVAILQNADLRRRMGIRGRKMVEAQYDWHALYDRWSNFYAQVRDCVVKRRSPRADISEAARPRGALDSTGPIVEFQSESDHVCSR